MARAAAFRKIHEAGDEKGPNVWPYFIGVFDTVSTLSFGNARFWPFVAGCFLALVVFVKAASWALGWLGWLFALPGLSWSWSAAAVALAALTVYAAACWRFGGWVSLARYRMAFYDDRLGQGVAFARHALSIDENRRDFARVAWTLEQDPSDVAQQGTRGQGPERLIQMWFAGVHSDVGGGYEEAEARLSDAALGWMADEVSRLHHPILVDPFYLRLSPSGTGIAHDELRSMRDRLWGPFKRFGWPFGLRSIPDDAPLHPSVLERFSTPSVVAYDQVGPYRPESLRHHRDVAHFYAGDENKAPAPEIAPG